MSENTLRVILPDRWKYTPWSLFGHSDPTDAMKLPWMVVLLALVFVRMPCRVTSKTDEYSIVSFAPCTVNPDMSLPQEAAIPVTRRRLAVRLSPANPRLVCRTAVRRGSSAGRPG